MRRILDPQFRYRSSFNTDLRDTFERVRREQLARERNATVKEDDGTKVVRLEELKKRAHLT